MACSIFCTSGTFGISKPRKRRVTCSLSALNSDASTRAYKGPGRPIMTERARAAVVAALASVDYVIIFDDADVASLLREFQPDVHAKGTDYTLDTVPEREIAQLLGIRTAICGDPKDHSTRDVIGRVRTERNG